MPQLVSFETSDQLNLPGLLYESSRPGKKALIYLHGNGSSSIFYSTKKTNLMADELNKIGFSFFPFNNRGAHYIKTLKKNVGDKKERFKYGTAYELIKDCVYDIDGAIAFLKTKGYSEFYLAGTSTGANKICVYNFYKPKNEVSGYILMAGGDDTGIYYQELGESKFYSALKKAQEYIHKGKGAQLVPRSLVDYVFSYQSLYDTINPDGDYNIFPYFETFTKRLGTKKLFQEYASIKKPTLVIYGELDEYCYGKVPEIIEVLKKETTAPDEFSFEIIQGADHGFDEKESELTKAVVTWLNKF